MENQQANILVVEDENEIRELISLILRREGHEILEAADAKTGLDILNKQKIDLVILDWMLPLMSGIEFLQAMRLQKHLTTKVIMVTAKADPQDIVEGLENGADDYITKPFEPMILCARVKAHLRRALQPKSSDNIEILIGNIKLNLKTYDVFIENESVQLTSSEFKILAEMGKNMDCVLTRDHFISIVQGEGVSVTGRTVDTHIFGLRKKLGESAKYIETVRGVGYRAKMG